MSYRTRLALCCNVLSTNVSRSACYQAEKGVNQDIGQLAAVQTRWAEEISLSQ
jgi:hypothetical protein